MDPLVPFPGNRPLRIHIFVTFKVTAWNKLFLSLLQAFPAFAWNLIMVLHFRKFNPVFQLFNCNVSISILVNPVNNSSAKDLFVCVTNSVLDWPSITQETTPWQNTYKLHCPCFKIFAKLFSDVSMHIPIHTFSWILKSAHSQLWNVLKWYREQNFTIPFIFTIQKYRRKVLPMPYYKL